MSPAASSQYATNAAFQLRVDLHVHHDAENKCDEHGAMAMARVDEIPLGLLRIASLDLHSASTFRLLGINDH